MEGPHGSSQEFLDGGCARDRHLAEHAALKGAVAVEHLHDFWGRKRSVKCARAGGWAGWGGLGGKRIKQEREKKKSVISKTSN